MDIYLEYIYIYISIRTFLSPDPTFPNEKPVGHSPDCGDFVRGLHVTVPRQFVQQTQAS